MDSFAKYYAFSCCYTGSDDDSNADSDLDDTMSQIPASGQSILMIRVHRWKIQRFVFADFQDDEVMDLTLENQEVATTTAAGVPPGAPPGTVHAASNGSGGKVGRPPWVRIQLLYMYTVSVYSRRQRGELPLRHAAKSAASHTRELSKDQRL